MWGVHFNLANLRCIEVIKSQRYEGSIRQRFLVNVAALRAVISVELTRPQQQLNYGCVYSNTTFFPTPHSISCCLQSLRSECVMRGTFSTLRCFCLRDGAVFL